MSTYERSLELMGTQEQLSVWRHEHTCSLFMADHGHSWTAMSAHEYGAIVPREIMSAHKHSGVCCHGTMNTHE